MEKEKWLQKISYYCYTAHSENGPIDGTWNTYLLDVLFACSTAVTHVKMTANTYVGTIDLFCTIVSNEWRISLKIQLILPFQRFVCCFFTTIWKTQSYLEL